MCRLRTLLLTGLLTLGCQVQAAGFRVITEEWAPYNYQDNGQPAGFAAELLQAALELLGEHPTIEFLPWNRAYKTALEEPDVLIFTIARTPERENLFIWVAPVISREVFLFRLAAREDIQPLRVADARRWKVGSNALQDASTQNLLRQGFVLGENLELITGKDEQNIHKLILGRIDLMPATPLQLSAAAKSAGYAVSKFVPTVLLSAAGEEYYFAFSLGTADERVERLRKAFAQLRADGTYAALVEKYTR